jgi:hypothetical protein
MLTLPSAFSFPAIIVDRRCKFKKNQRAAVCSPQTIDKVPPGWRDFLLEMRKTKRKKGDERRIKQRKG